MKMSSHASALMRRQVYAIRVHASPRRLLSAAAAAAFAAPPRSGRIASAAPNVVDVSADVR